MNNVKTIYDAIIKKRGNSNSGSSGGDEVNAKPFLKINPQPNYSQQFQDRVLNLNPLSKSAFAGILGVTESDIDNLLSEKIIGIQIHTDVIGSEFEPIDDDSILYLVHKNYPQSSCSGYSDKQVCYYYSDFSANNEFEFWTDGTNFAAERWSDSGIDIE